ncbi:peptidase domain-containing ABC transporter [Myroides odoratus]|uniref:Lactococcin-G-processing and transport ATP-binding protein LagD n=1 Tax=Myroides odoratus TaxID=256 RepID=A0A378RLE4_MYROD|nr:peptidase domain-containing ABC transporter [Myroides odoratus]QQU04740.1 peptidase domain-containing ABC transporter [Myroides odoratus]STZ27814.1 Lactococcin-G-processing and transport ATP-binding protein LagD [Myroides odoratus]
MNKFPNYIQADSKDCGPTCLKIIAKFYRKKLNIQKLRELCETTREGSTLFSISNAAEQVGFRTMGIKISLLDLKEAPLPCILFWNKNHFVVLYKVKKGKYYISDPAFGLLEYTEQEVLNYWIGNNATKSIEEGIALLLEPTPHFYSNELGEENKAKFGFRFLFKYLFKYKTLITQLAIGLLAGSLLQLVFPFLTQSIVDVGIQNQNLHFVYLILIAQLFLFFGKTALEFVRHWILLHLSIRINISLISDFFIKLMNLPISFFDVRMTGDIMQRINDHKRIERLLTNSSLDVLFSFVNMLIMGGILAYYNLQIFAVFVIGSLLYFGWIILFLKKREALDYKRFSEVSQEQSKVIELINGMQEIKLHNAEKQKRWGWEHIQARLFKVSIKGLVLEQVQGIGSNFINELKNIFIIFLSAKLVIDGEITLGMMMAISTIVGSLNGPIAMLINFTREAQDARISLARLAEIHNKEDETEQDVDSLKEIPKTADIYLKEVSFRYIGAQAFVLENLNLKIPSQKITAIVGTSGSGKTTLMKLLLKFYAPNEGVIQYGNTDLEKINQKAWRNHVGTVMQEGYIFNDSIANNIAIGEDIIDKKRLQYAVEVANIQSFIESLPLHYNTKIGMEGIGMSTGQKQRLLIARAVYKNPEMLFFDEATSALDANNEKAIMEKLNVFFKGKTVVIIAHRLSTVMNADNIVVLDQGRIIEQGNHSDLVDLKGNYYQLVKNQLQLGN